MRLKLAKDLSLPLDAVTQTFLVVGKRGSGKSNTAARLTEQFIRAKLPVVVLDVTDTWWGLKASHDGGQGLPVYVFGGSHADLPLEAGGGALIADVLCEHRMPMILSVKHLSGRERSAFMVAFAQTLFQKWGGGPLHVVLEEAHELAPQMAGSRSQNTDNEAAMLGAFKRLWKLGRASGIGGTAVTQRPASLSKDITTQSEILIAHRTIGPQDVKAVGEWVKYHGEHLDMLADLPSLPTGEAFIWAPEFPEGEPLGLRRTSILRRETFDSASTPKVGEKRVEPKELAPVDLERLQQRMAATIEKAKADDPKELRRQIAEKNKRISELEKATAGFTSSNEGRKQAVKPVLTDADRALLEKVVAALGAQKDAAWQLSRSAEGRVEVAVRNCLDVQRDASSGLVARMTETLERKGFQKILDKLKGLSLQSPVPSVAGRRADGPARASDRSRLPSSTATSTHNERRGQGAPATSGPSDLGKGERIVLTAAAQYPAGVTREQLTVLTGYARSSRDTYLQRLNAAQFIRADGRLITATEAGIAALGAFDPLPTGDALLQFWLGELGEGERKILALVAGAYPHELTREAISERTGYARSSRDTYLQRLSARRLVTTTRGTVTASEELFD